MAKQIEWSNEGIETFKDHISYIEKDSLLNADRFVDRVYEMLELISEHPFMGRITFELQDEMIREVFVYTTFRIIYEVFEEKIDILAVRRTAQAPNFKKDDN